MKEERKFGDIGPILTLKPGDKVKCFHECLGCTTDIVNSGIYIVAVVGNTPSTAFKPLHTGQYIKLEEDSKKCIWTTAFFELVESTPEKPPPTIAENIQQIKALQNALP